jgi:hypothetical protein
VLSLTKCDVGGLAGPQAGAGPVGEVVRGLPQVVQQVLPGPLDVLDHRVVASGPGPFGQLGLGPKT